ncbi:hypothetical protein SY88_00870 [Clostridiales bacterium PH28_bin88]|nr:hypothetical protein SY88_00870 [Clostridiales bacterium PH28_bin88]
MKSRLDTRLEGRPAGVADRRSHQALEQKVPQASQGVRDRIKEQDTYVLQQVIDNIFDINDLSELEDYLQ